MAAGNLLRWRRSPLPTGALLISSRRDDRPGSARLGSEPLAPSLTRVGKCTGAVRRSVRRFSRVWTAATRRLPCVEGGKPRQGPLSGTGVVSLPAGHGVRVGLDWKTVVASSGRVGEPGSPDADSRGPSWWVGPLLDLLG